MGYADESFSVYDRPKVLIFRNVERLPESRAAESSPGTSAGGL